MSPIAWPKAASAGSDEEFIAKRRIPGLILVMLTKMLPEDREGCNGSIRFIKNRAFTGLTRKVVESPM
jgi:hypothetical protein